MFTDRDQARRSYRGAGGLRGNITLKVSPDRRKLVYFTADSSIDKLFGDFTSSPKAWI